MTVKKTALPVRNAPSPNAESTDWPARLRTSGVGPIILSSRSRTAPILRDCTDSVKSLLVGAATASEGAGTAGVGGLAGEVVGPVAGDLSGEEGVGSVGGHGFTFAVSRGPGIGRDPYL